MQNLQPFHTFHLPVSAQKIVSADSVAMLREAWLEAKAQNLPVLLLGQGSNMLFLQDFQGVVIINALKGIEQRADADFHYLHVAAGENWHQLVQWSLQQDIYGLENLALIPGVAGSAPIQNIGAYGVEFKDVCDYVDVLELASGRQFRLTKEECHFGYRDSIFKRDYAHGYAIIAVGLKLAKNWQPVLQYGSLKECDPQQVTALAVFDEVCSIRRAKLPNPDELGNAGSFFKNPLVSSEQFAAIAQLSPNVPNFPQADGRVKLAAGWLIDQCGLKGHQIGGVAVHRQQALVLVNLGNATGADVAALAAYVRAAVWDKFAVALEPEVRFIGQTGEVDAVAVISGGLAL